MLFLDSIFGWWRGGGMMWNLAAISCFYLEELAVRIFKLTSVSVILCKDIVFQTLEIFIFFHISSVISKANKTLGFLYRHFGYSCIGPAQRRRSHLGYASEIWAAQSCKLDKKLLETVRRRLIP